MPRNSKIRGGKRKHRQEKKQEKLFHRRSPLKIDLGNFLYGGAPRGGFKKFRTLQIKPGSEHGTGKLPDRGIEITNRIIVARACHGNPVFRSGKLILKPGEVLIRFQVRIRFRYGKQAPECTLEGGIRLPGFQPQADGNGHRRSP